MRAFAWFVGAILLAGIAAALIAYPIYLGTVHVANFAFHRVASRIAMLLLLLELVWLCRHFELNRKADFGYGAPWRAFVRQSLLFALIGIGSAALGAWFLLASGARVADPQFHASWGAYLRILGVGVSSGVAVALLEETVFRGALQTAMTRETGAVPSALAASVLFAVLHLFAKARIPAEELTWSSGFDLIARSFAPLAHPALAYDSLLAWFAIGLLLSLTRALTGNIAVALGLHAGWVIVLRMMQESTQSAPAYESLWVGRFDGLVGLWMLPWTLVLAALLWVSRSRWAKR
jgi:membrane protease YdiL (CAAX protease family)